MTVGVEFPNHGFYITQDYYLSHSENRSRQSIHVEETCCCRRARSIDIKILVQRQLAIRMPFLKASSAPPGDSMQAMLVSHKCVLGDLRTFQATACAGDHLPPELSYTCIPTLQLNLGRQRTSPKCIFNLLFCY